MSGDLDEDLVETDRRIADALGRQVAMAGTRRRVAVQMAMQVDGGSRDLAQRHVREHEGRTGGTDRGSILAAEAGAAELLELVDVVVADDQQPIAWAGGQVDREVWIEPRVEVAGSSGGGLAGGSGRRSTNGPSSRWPGPASTASRPRTCR